MDKKFYPVCRNCGVPIDDGLWCDVACQADFKAKKGKLITGILADLARLQKLNEKTLDNYLKSCDEQAQILRSHNFLK